MIVPQHRSQAQPDRNEMHRALDVLTAPGQPVELRALYAHGGAFTRVYTNRDELVNQAVAFGETAKGVYITLNPVRTGVESNTKDTDIKRRCWLPIDVDPQRATGASATDEEHEGAHRVAASIREFLNNMGWPEPVAADSGNGAHLLYPLDLPNDSASRTLVEQALKSLDFLFSDERQNVDTSVHNAARIWKLYGTVARKGANTPDRPHRIARLTQTPEHIEAVNVGQLQAVAALLPDKQQAASDGETKALDIAAWLDRQGITVRRAKPWMDGMVYELEECPWSETHSDSVDGACIIQFPNGALAFKCQHAHCQDKRWQDFRSLYEPDYDKRSQALALYVEPELEFSDAGNALRLAREYGAGLKYVRQWGWLVYRDGRWQRDDDGYAMQCAKTCIGALLREAALPETDNMRRGLLLDHARRSFNANRLQAMLKLAESEPGIVARVDHFDTDPWLLNVQNGTLDLRTGKLRPHSPDDMITKLAPVTYDPQASAPRWAKFLEEVFESDRDLIGFVQRALGYSTTGVTREQVFFNCWGAGNNGKSTLLNAVACVLGDYAKPLDADVLMEQPFKSSSSADPEIASLVGARFVTAQEPHAKELDTAKVKELTGQDPIQVREMYKMPFTLVPQFKLWLSANERPNVTEANNAIWRRIRLIPFTVNFENRKDETLPERLAVEASGILNWLLVGLAAWRERGLGNADAVLEATREYREEEDPYFEFFAELLKPGNVDSRVEQKIAYAAFKTWAQTAGVQIVSEREFPRHAEAHGYVRKRTNGKRWLLGCILRQRFGEHSADSADNGLFSVRLSHEGDVEDFTRNAPTSALPTLPDALPADGIPF